MNKNTLREKWIVENNVSPRFRYFSIPSAKKKNWKILVNSILIERESLEIFLGWVSVAKGSNKWNPFFINISWMWSLSGREEGMSLAQTSASPGWRWVRFGVREAAPLQAHDSRAAGPLAALMQPFICHPRITLAGRTLLGGHACLLAETSIEFTQKYSIFFSCSLS